MENIGALTHISPEQYPCGQNYYNEILSSMKERLESPASLMEGSFSSQILQPVAYELAKQRRVDIDTMPYKVFALTAWGTWLDLVAADYGMERKAAAFASVELEIHGNPGTQIPEGTEFLSENGTVFVLQEVSEIPSAGTASLLAASEISGKAGNVPAMTVNRFRQAVPGLVSVVNPRAASGGTETESDRNFRGRILEKIRKPAHSGNVSDYRQWALSVIGVTNVRVIPLARGNGTVDVVILGDIADSGREELVRRVQAYIDANRPVGADPLVKYARFRNVDVTADVMVASGHTLSGIKPSFTQLVSDYLEQLIDSAAVDSKVSYHKITSLLFAVPGVLDVFTVKVNGGEESLILENDEIPAVGFIDLIGRA